MAADGSVSIASYSKSKSTYGVRYFVCFCREHEGVLGCVAGGRVTCPFGYASDVMQQCARAHAKCIVDRDT